METSMKEDDMDFPEYPALCFLCTFVPPPPTRSLICILQLHYYYTSLLFIPLVSVISPPAHTYKSPAFSLPHNKLMPHTWQDIVNHFFDTFLWDVPHLRCAAASNRIIAREDEGSLTDDREAGQRTALTDNLSLPPLSFFSHHFSGWEPLRAIW